MRGETTDDDLGRGPDDDLGPGPDTTAGRDRGQTAIDFAIGAGVFLVVVAAVVTFIPGMFAPFEGTDPTAAADRFAASLSGDLLGHPSDKNTLDPACTVAFFGQMQGENPTHDCRFGDDEDDLGLVFATDHTVNATIEERPQGGAIAERNGTRLAAGPASTGQPDVTVSRQVVLLDDRSYRLIVRVW